METLPECNYEEVNIAAPWGNISGRWYGNREERPILAIHGWLDNLGTYDTLVPLLPDYLGVLCIDLPGHGLSDHFPTGMQYSRDDYMMVIQRIMKEYNWSRVSLMGHSMGAVVCFSYTMTNPHLVDMLITLDGGIPNIEPRRLDYFAYTIEKRLIEDERSQQLELHEPPSYALDELRELVARGTSGSVPLEYANHLLYRSVTKSKMYPEKYYFSRDGRSKYYYHAESAGMVTEMARRIKKTPFLFIQASNTIIRKDFAREPLAILAQQNPNFEIEEVMGTHHVHLLNAAGCAEVINPFIRRHRPPPVSSWTLEEGDKAIGQKEKTKRRKAMENFFSLRPKWYKSKL